MTKPIQALFSKIQYFLCSFKRLSKPKLKPKVKESKAKIAEVPFDHTSPSYSDRIWKLVTQGAIGAPLIPLKAPKLKPKCRIFRLKSPKGSFLNLIK